MLQAPRDACFIRELLVKMRLPQMLPAEQLNRNFAVQFEVTCLKNDSHPAARDHGAELKTPQNGAFRFDVRLRRRPWSS